MDYMTLKEASEKWEVSVRQINYYCTGDRIPGLSLIHISEPTRH